MTDSVLAGRTSGRRMFGDGRVSLSLVNDRALEVEVEAPVLPLVTRWLPRAMGDDQPPSTEGATILVTQGTQVGALPEGAPTVRLGSVRAWVGEKEDVVELRGADAASVGRIEFQGRRAVLAADRASSTARSNLYSMLTVSAALFLADLGRALVHAAGVVSPDGGAWLLVGDSGAGKSTTCANLSRLGWGYLSDDQVVLTREADRVAVEGWLRPFHLAPGHDGRDATSQDTEVDEAGLGPGRWHATAPLRGLLFPTIRPDNVTELAPTSAVDALGGLLRQTPWLLVRRRTAADGWRLLRSTVGSVPAFHLRLGRDTHRGGKRLHSALKGLPIAVPVCVPR